MVRSLGCGPEGEPPIPDAVAAMQRRGLDVSAHRSRKVKATRVRPADLILTAERDHVIKLSAEAPDAGRRAFTFPEFVRLAAAKPFAGGDLREWAETLSVERSATDYLAGGNHDDVWDPTGSAPRRFRSAVDDMALLCRQVAVAITPPTGDDIVFEF